MAKLQVLSGPTAGQSYELKVETTTVGRVEDNALQIADPSVSSRHCEFLLRGDEVIVSRLDHDSNIRPWMQAAEAVAEAAN